MTPSYRHHWPLERLHARLGRPAWFWPTVIFTVFGIAPLTMELLERLLP